MNCPKCGNGCIESKLSMDGFWNCRKCKMVWRVNSEWGICRYWHPHVSKEYIVKCEDGTTGGLPIEVPKGCLPIFQSRQVKT